MSKLTLTPGTRVRVFPEGTKGTIVDTPAITEQFRGFVAVAFDGADKASPCSPDNLVIIEPEAPAEFPPGTRVTDAGNGRLGTVADDPEMTAEYPGMIPVHWDNDWRSCAAPSILAPVADGIEKFSESEIVEELERRGVPLPPAGFKMDTAGTTVFVGPEHVADTWRVLTHWTPQDGIRYCLDTDESVWTPAQVEALPAALESIKQEIDLAAALVHLRSHPKLAMSTVTVNDLITAAQGQGLGWGAMAEAWGTLRDAGQLASK